VGWHRTLRFTADEADASVRAVRSLVVEVQAFFDAGRFADAIDRGDQVVESFAEAEPQLVQERVAYALLLKGLSLEKLGRSEEGVLVYERLVARYVDSPDTKTRRHVAWALNNRAFVLKELGRREEAIASYDELIARFADSRAPEIRQRVAWAFWNKADVLRQLARDAEAGATYEQLIARHDEGLNDELDRNIGWCMEYRAFQLGPSGDPAEQLALCDELVERFGSSSDPSLQRNVLGALRMRAARLGALGRGSEALASYDEALARLDGVSEPGLRHEAVPLLLSKGETLGRLGRLEEAIVVYDSAVSAYRAASASGGAIKVLWAAVLALLYKLGRLCELGRSDEAHALPAQLAAILADVETTPSDGELTGPQPAPESQLAATVADVFNGGDCWRWFEASNDELPLGLMAERAIELYRLSEPWLFSDGDAASLAATAAAGMLRDIADGYALLSRPVGPREREALPLPTRQPEDKRTQLVRDLGIDEWAADLGYPLALPDCTSDTDAIEAGEQLLEQTRAEVEDSTERFLAYFLTSAHAYDLLCALADSESGRHALQDENLKNYATWQLKRARKWVRWYGPQVQDAAGAALASLFIAQGFFLASHGAIPTRAALFPDPSTLRFLLHETGAHEWLISQDAEIPQSLSEDDD
jgi:tetratricopeptide (TPR) repeat protein